MPAILQDIREKIKPYLEDDRTFTGLVLILVAATAFGLGRQSIGENASVKAEANLAAPIKAEIAPMSEEEESLPSTYYVGSRNGEVYHLPHCSGAKRINEVNKVTFETKAEAEAAGYRPAANCKGI